MSNLEVAVRFSVKFDFQEGRDRCIHLAVFGWLLGGLHKVLRREGGFHVCISGCLVGRGLELAVATHPQVCQCSKREPCRGQIPEWFELQHTQNIAEV